MAQGGRDTTEIYLSTGGAFELVHEADAFATGLVGTESGFFVSLSNGSSTTLLTSRDGRSWSELANPQSMDGALVGYDDQTWWVTWEPDGFSVLWGSTTPGDWSRVADLEGLAAIGPLAAGPGGLALVVRPTSPNDDDQGLPGPQTWVGRLVGHRI